MKKYIIFLLSLLAVFSLIALPTNAEKEKKHVYDNADYLSADEEARLEEVLENASTHGVFYAVYTSIFYIDQYEYDGLIEDLGFSVSDDLALLAVYPPQRSGAAYGYNLAVYGVADRGLDDDEYNAILDHDDVMDNIYAGNLLEGLSAFPSLTQFRIEHDRNKNGVGFLVSFNQILMALGAMLVTFLVFFFSVRSSYRKKNKGGQYPLDKYSTTEITNRSDRYSHRHVSVVTISKSSGGGGSHGGGGGGARGGGR